MSNIIASGTYGCVSRPSLKCVNSPNIDYKNKVSKIMNTFDAVGEYKEMEKISRIKGIEKYAIPMPIICKPENNEELKKTFSDCDSKMVHSYPIDLALLILEDGGIDLAELINKKIIDGFNFNQWKTFLNSIKNLFEGLIFFNKNDIIHHDIKLANIVYNVNTGNIRFIDFGIMMSKTDFISKSANSMNGLSQSWEYFPKEYSCANYNVFKTRKCVKYNSSMNYDIFIKKIANTFDLYCLCHALNIFFKKINYNNLQLCTEEEKNKIMFVVNKMTSFLRKFYATIDKRESDINFPRDIYVELLRQKDMLSNNIYKPSDEVLSLVKKNSAEKYIKREKSSCPEHKIRNPVTGKCVIKKVKKSKSAKMREPCPENKVRNPKTGRCVTQKIKISKSAKMREPCPENKVRNPKTGRCVTQKKKYRN
jgi:hypothetical protein